MKDELNLQQLKAIVQEVRYWEKEHPKANVTYDTEKNRINITYPMPKDFWQVKDIKISNFDDLEAS
jgi:hypothetical protein